MIYGPPCADISATAMSVPGLTSAAAGWERVGDTAAMSGIAPEVVVAGYFVCPATAVFPLAAEKEAFEPVAAFNLPKPLASAMFCRMLQGVHSGDSLLSVRQVSRYPQQSLKIFRK